MDAVEISNDAGMYLCEFVFFKALHYSRTIKSGNLPALFIHVPPYEDKSDFADHVQAVLKCIVHNLCVNIDILRHKNWKSKTFNWYLNLKTRFKPLTAK
jgi:pyrrolidone-carboxylate peptidase